MIDTCKICGRQSDQVMKVKWLKYNPRSPELPKKYKLCLLQIEPKSVDRGDTVPAGLSGLPAAVAVGYLKWWSDGPFWVIPGVGGTVTRYADCLPDDLNPKCWPGFCPSTAHHY